MPPVQLIAVPDHAPVARHGGSTQQWETDMNGTRKRTINDPGSGTARARAGTSWTAPRRLIGVFAAVAAFASTVTIAPTQVQAATALSVSLAITGNANPGVPASTLRAGGCVTVQVSYSVGGEDLSNAKIRMSLPAQDWNNSTPATSSGRVIDLPFSGPPTNNVSTETWASQYTSPDSIIDLPIGNPDVPAGTVGAVTVNLCSNNGVNPNGALLHIAASLIGTNGTIAAAPISITNYASNGVFPGNVSKTATTIVPALGPPAVNSTNGYELSWNVELASPCTTTGCGPLVGALLDSMPVGSYLASVSRIGFTSTTPIVPAPHPATGLDISTFPAVGTLFTSGNQNITVPVFIWPSNCTSNSGSGAISQGKSALPEMASQTCATEYPVSVNRRGFRVTVWVPLPAALTTVTNTFSLNRDPAWDAITSPVVKTASHILDGSPSLTFTKSFNNSGSGDCTANAGPYQPGQAAVGDARCTIFPEGLANDYVLRFNSTAPVANAYVIDKLPAPLQLRAALAPPSGWTASYTTDSGCGLATLPTDPMWTTVVPPVANIVCVMFTNPLTDTLANTLVVPILVRPGQIPAPGSITLVSNSAFGTGSNLTPATTDRTATRVVSILNRHDLTQRVFATPTSVVAGNQTVIRINGQDLPLLGNFGAHNWTMKTTLPPDLDFVPAGMAGSDFQVTSAPKDTTSPLVNLAVNCSYTLATRVVRCVAVGDAVNATTISGAGAVVFDVGFAARVRLGTTNDLPITAYGYNDLGAPADYPTFGPVDGAGDSLSFIDTPTRQSSANTSVDVVSSPALNLAKTVDGGVTDVTAGDTVSYTLSVNHLANSTADLTNAYVYDFMGRNPATGTVIGTVAPSFVSTTVGSQPIAIAYSCTATPSIANAIWVAAPCGTVTGLRFRPAYDDQLNVTTDGLYPIGAPALTIGVTVQAPISSLHLGTIANQAGVTSDQQPGTLLSSQPTVAVHQPADLSIVKTDSGNTGATVGSTITYTVTVGNGAANDALPSSSIVVSDTLPASLAPETAGGSGWSCTLTAQTFTCSRTSALAANTALPVITITGTVLPGAPSSISNTAVIIVPSDLNPNNDQSTATTFVVASPVPTTTFAPTTTTTVPTVPATTTTAPEPTTTVPTTTVPAPTVPATTVPAPPTTLTTPTATTPIRAATTAPGPLPVTGSDAVRLLMLAGSSLLFGLLLLALCRRRRSANAG